MITENLEGKRLDELTEDEKARVFVPGNVLHYWDRANPGTEFTIVSIETDKWGTHAELIAREGNDEWEDSLTISAGFQRGWTVKKINNVSR